MGVSIIGQFIFSWITIQLFILCVWLFARGVPVQPFLFVPSWLFTLVASAFTAVNMPTEFMIAHETNDYTKMYGSQFSKFYIFWIRIVVLASLIAFWFLLYFYMVHVVSLVYVLFPLFFGSIILSVIGLLPLQSQYRSTTNRRDSDKKPQNPLIPSINNDEDED